MGAYAAIYVSTAGLWLPSGGAQRLRSGDRCLKPGAERISWWFIAEHPDMIADTPWCAVAVRRMGFSETLSRWHFPSVVLEVTDEVRIEPFGVHIWNDWTRRRRCSWKRKRNYQPVAEHSGGETSSAMPMATFRLAHRDVVLAPGETKVIKQSAQVENPAQERGKIRIYTVWLP